MTNLTLSLFSAAVVALSPFALCQDASSEEHGPPKPAPELQKFAPLIGNWQGKGVFHDPKAGDMKWTARGSYRWVLSNFWVEEDFWIEFEGQDAPMVFRAYMGWDAENQRFVNLHVSNDGALAMDELVFSPEGAMVGLMRQQNGATHYCERAVTKVNGDKMTMAIDFLMASGPSSRVVEGEFERVDAVAPTVLTAGAMGDKVEPMAKLVRAAGVYDVKGSMTWMPGMPAMNIHGTDTYTALFGGAVLHGHTDGGSDMSPEPYYSHVFWGWDQKKKCYRGIYVSNMGECGQMEMRYSQDGKHLVTTNALTKGGVPMVQRFVLTLDENGAFQKGVSHAIIDAGAPMKDFEASYTKKSAKAGN
ncbi:MAG: DUF1579 domain-containing protein [bacterium]|nr:DUF1579 domain-containing protein [bacterium]